MKELKDLLEIVKHETGASPVVAKFLLSIANLSAEVNINTLLTKVSSKMYFHIIDNIKKNQKFLSNVLVKEGL